MPNAAVLPPVRTQKIIFSALWTRPLALLTRCAFVVMLIAAARPEAHAQGLDLNHDGRFELALYHPGELSVLDSLGLEQRIACPGVSNIPLTGRFLQGIDAQLATWNPSFGVFSICSQTTTLLQPWGEPGDRPLAADFTGDGLSDYVVYRPSTREWLVLVNNGSLGSSQVLKRFEPNAPADAIPSAADFDGDGRADFTLVIPDGGRLRWRTAYANGSVGELVLGQTGELPVPADYDGDGRAEPASYNPGTGRWTLLGGDEQLGLAGDLPSPFDFDGDSRADLAVYRPTSNRWYLRLSIDPSVLRESAFLGAPGIPVSYAEASNVTRTAPLDFNGDRLSDFVVVRRTQAGSLLFLFDSAGSAIPARPKVELGSAGDRAFTADFDGDGVSDPSIAHNLASGDIEWIILESSAQKEKRTELHAVYGRSTDLLVPADYDGDRRTDLAVVRDIGGFLVWIPLPSGKQALPPVSWGLKGDTPLSGDVDGDGRSDYLLARTVGGEIHWFIRTASGDETFGRAFGVAGDQPIVADIDGDSRAEIGVAREQGGAKLMFFANGQARSFGLSGDTTFLASFSGSRALTNVAWRLIGGQGFFFVLNPALGPQVRPFGVTGDRPLLPSGLTSTSESSSSAQGLHCATRTSVRAQESGFSFKPASDSDGKLAILFGPSRKKKIVDVALVLEQGSGAQVIEVLRFVGNKGGTRPTFRASKPGSAYPNGVVLVRKDTSKQNHCIDVDNPSSSVP